MKFNISTGFLLTIVFFSLLFSSSKLTAQNRPAVQGELLDSVDKHPLELATVAIVNAIDTTLIAYTLSDRHGHFELTGLPAGRAVRVIISYVGYKVYRSALVLEKGRNIDLGQILFIPASLSEVVIRGVRSPVVVKKDTIEFNTEAFKTRPNAVVEELLKKLPGVQINTDGSILFHGRPVSKLLINGKAFFGNDPTVGTRNLDAGIIDKVQVFDDRDQDQDNRLSETEVNKVINLKLKKNIKKSTIGKAYVGGGTRGRYEGGGIISSFRDTLQVSLVGLGNNLNGTKLSYDDLNSMGGFDRSGGNQINNGTFGRTADDPNSLKGTEEVKAGGFNINNDYGDRLKLNLVYFYTNKKTTNVQKQRVKQMIPDSLGLTSLSGNNTLTTVGKHSIGASVIWNPDSLNNFRYEPSATFVINNKQIASTGSSYNDTIPLINRSFGANKGSGHENSFSHNFSWHRKLRKKGESLYISHSLAINKEADEDQTFNDLTSFTKDLNSTIFDRLALTRSTSNSVDLNINYNYPVSHKLSAQFTVSTGYNTSSYRLFNYNKDAETGRYDLFLENQSNLLNRSVRTEGLNPLLIYKINDRIRVSVGVNSQWQNVDNRFLAGDDINHHYFNFLPSVTIHGAGISVSYNEQISQPSILQLQPDTIRYSQLYKVAGNPVLLPRHSHYIGVTYNKYNENTQANLSVYGSVDLSKKNVVQDYTINSTGNTMLSYVNGNNGLNTSFTVNYNQNFKKMSSWQNSMNIYFLTSYSRNAFLLNENEGIESTSVYAINCSAYFNYNDLLTLGGQYELNRSATVYKKVPYKPVSNYVQYWVPSINLNWPKRISFDASCTINYNPQVPPGFRKESNLLNAAISVQIQSRDRGQLKLSAYDLLNQNVSVYQSASNNAILVNEQQLLKRYFLLTYMYKFNTAK